MAKVSDSVYFARAGGLLQNQVALPEYQRDWVWDSEKVTKLCRDILDHSNRKSPRKADHELDAYFIGNIVTTEDRRKIVDGQQRITSLTLMACALRDVLLDHGKIKYANDVHFSMIMREVDEYNSPRYLPIDSPEGSPTSTRVQLRFFQTVGKQIDLKTSIISSEEEEDEEIKIRFEEGSMEWRLGKNTILKIGEKQYCYVGNSIDGGTDLSTIKVKRLEDGNHLPEDGDEIFIANQRKNIEEFSGKFGTEGFKKMHTSYIRLKSIFAQYIFGIKWSLKSGKNITARKVGAPQTFEFKNEFGYVNPVSFKKGYSSELNWEDEENGAKSINLVSENENVIYKPRRIVAKIEQEVKIPRGALSLHKIPERDPADCGWLTEEDSLIKSVMQSLENVHFAVTNFVVSSDALKHFIMTNNTKNAATLSAYDMFLATAQEIIDSLASGSENEQNSAGQIRTLWSNIQEIIYFKRGKDRLHASKFLGWFLLAIGHLNNKNEPYRWGGKLENVDAFVGLDIYLRKEEYWDTFNGWQHEGCLKFFQKMERMAESMMVAREPESTESSEILPNVQTRALLNIIKRKTTEIHFPMFMAVREKCKDEGANGEEIVNRFLTNYLYVLVRFWVIPDLRRDATLDDDLRPTISMLNEKHLHAMYRGAKRITLKIKETEEIDEVSKLPLIAINDEDTKQKIDSGKFPWKTGGGGTNAHSDLRKLQGSNDKLAILVFLHEYLLYGDEDEQIQNRFLVKRGRQEFEEGPEIEHIFPQKADLEDWEDWDNDDLDKRNYLGNRCLLEWKINSHVKNDNWAFRKNSRNCEDGCVKHYDSSALKRIRKVRNKQKWTPNDVVKHGKDMIKEIVLWLDERKEELD